MVSKDEIVEKPFFSIRSRFYPIVVAYAYPVRISGILLVLLFMLPELAQLFSFITGLDTVGVGGFFSYILAIVVVSTLSFFGPLLMTWLDYKVVTYSFYKDRVEFIYGFWVREKLSIPYRGITEVITKVNWVQNKYKIGNIRLVAEPKLAGIKTKQQGHELPDIRNPDRAIANIEKLLHAFREQQSKRK